ncbi:MAG: MarR family transcriptional regulator [Lachnospiraceae bacterium]
MQWQINSPERLRYLFSILQNQEEEITITRLASLHNVVKSTVSRAVKVLEEEGLVSLNPLKLTTFGTEVVSDAYKNYTILTRWLMRCYQLSAYKASNDALTMLTSLSLDFLNGILQSQERYEVFNNLVYLNGKDDSWIRNFKGGEYPINFTFYRVLSTQNDFFSMANEGFVHNGKLICQNGHGLVCIEARKMVGNSLLKGLAIQGKAKKVYYENKNSYYLAREDGNHFYIPSNSFMWKYEKEEGRMKGCIRVKIQPSVSEQHMPDSEAILAVDF